MVQRRPDREHGEDQRQKPPLDEGKRLFRVDAAGQQDDGDTDDGEDEDRRHTQPRQRHDARQHAKGNRRLVAAIGLHRRLRDIDKVHVGGQTLNILGRAFQQQGITDHHHQIVQLAADILVPPMHRQRIDAVTAAQAKLPQRPPDHAAAGRDQHLHRLGLDRGQLVHQPNVLVFLHAQEFRHLGPQDHPVTRLQHHRIKVAAQRGIAAQHIDQPHAGPLEEIHIQRTLPDQPRILRQRHLGKEFQLAPVAQEPRHRLPLRQHAAPDKAEIGKAHKHLDQAQGRDLEDRKGRKARIAPDTVHQKVGRGADQRDRTAKDRGIGQGNQKL